MPPDSSMPNRESTATELESPCCKVQRTAVTFEIADVVDELTTMRKEGKSFRDIATYFNTTVVERVLSKAGLDDGRSIHAALTGGDIAGDVYEVLRTDRDSDIRRAEVRARLSDAGIAVSELESAFVSHVTISSHLKQCVGVEPKKSSPPFEQTVNTTQGARARAVNIIQSTIDRAVRNGQLQTGQLQAEFLVQVTCQDCGDRFYLTELLEERQCSCFPKSNPEN